MASKEELGKQVLDEFKHAYEHMKEAKAAIAAEIAITPKEKVNKRFTMLVLAGQIKVVQSAMKEVHHAIGHSFFDDCWTDVPVGDEDKADGPLKGLFDSLHEAMNQLGIKAEVEAIDLDEPVPDDLPEPIRKMVEDLKRRRKMSERGHLN